MTLTNIEDFVVGMRVQNGILERSSKMRAVVWGTAGRLGIKIYKFNIHVSVGLL